MYKAIGSNHIQAGNGCIEEYEATMRRGMRENRKKPMVSSSVDLAPLTWKGVTREKTETRVNQKCRKSLQSCPPQNSLGVRASPGSAMQALSWCTYGDTHHHTMTIVIYIGPWGTYECSFMLDIYVTDEFL